MILNLVGCFFQLKIVELIIQEAFQIEINDAIFIFLGPLLDHLM